ncbi:MAG TPA: PadR family transcriptional regulator [Dongiaceae bacterium]|nr:PadR family transcriptional regulator [Dongiaceae bacterium]
MASEKSELVRGTLEMLILKALAAGPLHGLGVSRRIAQVTRGAFAVGPGSLFPALHRMEEEGWLAATWSESENRRRARFYTLTRAGRRQLQQQSERWGRVSLAIARALEST